MTDNIAGYRIHPIAAKLPLISDAELAQLAERIRIDRQLEPIVLDPSGVVIDGRNRLLACERAGKEPITVTREFADEAEIAAFIYGKNITRRHLNESQRAMLGADLVPLFEKKAKERQDAGRRKGGEATSAVRHGSTAPGRSSAAAPRSRQTAAADAAPIVHASPRSIERAKLVKERSPELAKKVLAGEATLKQAEKQLRHAEQVRAAKKYRPPTGKYSVIVADPPWMYEDALDGSDEARGGLPYPPMPLEEICKLEVEKLADKDCVLWLWVTNAHLLDGSAHQVLEHWGFEPKTMLTWVKDRMGAGRWLRGRTEHVILAIRGKPKIDLTNQTTVLEAPRREHSRKPDEFFRLVEQLCPATSRLELFAREPRKSWVTSGAEAEKFAP